MNDPHIERILREAKDEGDGRVIALLVVLALAGIGLACLYFMLSAAGRM